MIVALAAWLYIIHALLGLISLRYGGGGAGTVATLLMSGLCGAMGYGLLKREAWARWLALGVSLLSWVFGTIFFIFLLGVLATSGKSGAFIGMMFSGAFAILSVILVIALLIMLVSIVISFKLFFHLCSEEGCEEFGVPYGSAGTVVASVGAWLAIMFGQFVLSSGGSSGLMLAALQGMSHERDESSPEAQQRRRLEAERRDHELRVEEQRRHAEQEARLRQIREAENQQALAAAARDANESGVTGVTGVTTADTSAPPVEEAPAPVIDNRPVEEEKTSGSTILKCRDASGSVMFTQGYCPPGTQRVEMPKSE